MRYIYPRNPGQHKEMMRKNTTLGRSLIAVMVCLITCGSVPVLAFHIIGGEITYRCLGDGQTGTKNYAFRMQVYRDCAGLGAQFDSPAEIGVYRLVNGVYSFVNAYNVNHGAVTLVPAPDNPCLIIPPNICVQTTTYDFNIPNLPVINGSYFIFWRRCCRNATINNIVDARNVGATFSVEITARAQELCNQSPTFRAFPPTVICAGEPLMFDHSATDIEGDQLVYEFCSPLEGGGPLGGQGPGSGNDRSCNGIRPDPAICPPPFVPVTFIAPTYSAVNPLGGNPQITIDPLTGMITGTPNLLGQFVVGVCVKEYRNGELLSVLQRDFQFNVSTCQISVEAAIQADTTLDGQRFVVNSCGNFTIDFFNESERQANISTYLWEFDLGGGNMSSSSTRHTSVTFPGLGSYQGTMVINRGLICSDTAEIFVNIYPEIVSDFEFDYDTCFGAPVLFTDLSFTGSGQMTNWFWDFGDGRSSVQRNPSHLYAIPGNHDVTLRVRDINRCEDARTKTISYFPVPPVIIVDPSTFNGCVPATVFFDNLSTPIDETYDIRWEFGDGGTSNEISPTHTYTTEGLYSLRVSITSPIGCFISADFDAWIQVKPSPQAGFFYSPEILNNFNRQVSFTDQSRDASGWQWTFGDESIAFVKNPVYMFRDTGLYSVTQIVFHENGCTDTATALLDVVPEVRYFLPNAFTPNFDANNDVYRGVGVFPGIQEFEMSIWARWGERVFYTNDPLQGWNGRKNNTGEDLPMGVYVCVVKFRDPRNNLLEIKEFATLIR